MTLKYVLTHDTPVCAHTRHSSTCAHTTLQYMHTHDIQVRAHTWHSSTEHSNKCSCNCILVLHQCNGYDRCSARLLCSLHCSMLWWSPVKHFVKQHDVQTERRLTLSTLPNSSPFSTIAKHLKNFKDLTFAANHCKPTSSSSGSLLYNSTSCLA